jgi:hypothetical protein
MMKHIWRSDLLAAKTQKANAIAPEKTTKKTTKKKAPRGAEQKAWPRIDCSSSLVAELLN